MDRGTHIVLQVTVKIVAYLIKSDLDKQVLSLIIVSRCGRYSMLRK